jgi:hypothetical protein
MKIVSKIQKIKKDYKIEESKGKKRIKKKLKSKRKLFGKNGFQSQKTKQVKKNMGKTTVKFLKIKQDLTKKEK